MKFGSYMKDYHDTYVCGKDDTRCLGKAMFCCAGVITLLIGLFGIQYSILAGTLGILGGIGVITYSIIYFRKA